MLAWLQDLPWVAIALVALAAPGVALFGVNQYEEFRRRHSKPSPPMSQWTTERVESLLRDWMFKGTQFTIKDDPQPNAMFQFIAEDVFGLQVLTTRLNSHPDELLLWANLSISEKNRSKFDNLPEPIRSDLMEDLRIEMARFGIEYIGFDFPIRRMVVQRWVKLDEIKDRIDFWDKVGFVRRAVALVSELLHRAERRSDILASPSASDKGGS